MNQEAVHRVLINHYGETLTVKLISIIETEINQEDNEKQIEEYEARRDGHIPNE